MAKTIFLGKGNGTVNIKRTVNLVIRISTQMGESSLWSQAQGEGHKKQEKVMSRTFVNFSQVKTETATTA